MELERQPTICCSTTDHQIDSRTDPQQQQLGKNLSRRMSKPAKSFVANDSSGGGPRSPRPLQQQQQQQQQLEARSPTQMTSSTFNESSSENNYGSQQKRNYFISSSKWTRAILKAQEPVKRFLTDRMAVPAAQHPKRCIVIVLFTSFLLAIVGVMTNFRIESSEVALWTPRRSQPAQDHAWIQNVLSTLKQQQQRPQQQRQRQLQQVPTDIDSTSNETTSSSTQSQQGKKKNQRSRRHRLRT